MSRRNAILAAGARRRHTPAAWHGELRAVDLLARHGGEEFALLLPDAGERAAAEIVERLRVSTPERDRVRTSPRA